MRGRQGRPLPAAFPSAVRDLLRDFLARAADVLEGSVDGIVLFGSLVAGDFDPATSDLDLLVALSADIDDPTLEALRRMHARLAADHPAWEDRLDVAYVPSAALRTSAERDSPLVVLSRGEPLHRTRTDPGWTMNWHVAREAGVALLGPDPRDLIATTAAAGFVSAVRFHMRWMLARAEAADAPELRAYAIVTACRALYTCATGAQTSKTAATRWAERRYPEWAAPIREARLWRRGAAQRREAARAPIAGGLEFLRFAAREVARSAEPAGDPD